MSYVVHNFVDGDIIQATPMNEMDAQIQTNETNIGLKVPKTDIVDNLTTNDSTKVLSAAQGKALKDSLDNINKSTLRDVPFAIAVSDWSSVTGGFSATFNTAYVTTASKEILTYDNSLASYAKAHINAAKKSGGGGITFTTATKPTGTITGNAYVFDNDDHKIPTLIESTVTPIANGGTGQSSLAGAQQALGITALSNQIAQKIVTRSKTLTSFGITGHASSGIYYSSSVTIDDAPSGYTIIGAYINGITGAANSVMVNITSASTFELLSGSSQTLTSITIVFAYAKLS